eukprot:TRINITY_DN18554_c0_g1_i1.p1 TRINITY_DN18554_c0_g1~~TRINITY_DN18554_c0_g1_i1.p1  ORF type:complete len:1893 (+),score=374.82 TRINITY_DN18554_c0_g1_i1:168-5846(+)
MAESGSTGPDVVLLRAGSSWLTIRFSAANVDAAAIGLDVEHRQTARILSAPWAPVPATSFSPEDVQGCLAQRGFVDVTLHDLEPSTSYDVRISVLMPGEARQCCQPTTFRTLRLAPPLETPPWVKHARFDRVLLHWLEPSTQAEEVVAYRVRYYDCSTRWVTRHETEVKLASWLLRPSEQTTLFLEGQAAMHVSPSTAAPSDEADEIAASGQSERQRSQVHCWLLGLAPTCMFYAQVAAVTAKGVGDWSPKSQHFFTWRVAPKFSPPQQLLSVHSAIVVGLAVEPAPRDQADCVQDEEVVEVEVTFTSQASQDPPITLKCGREEAVRLARRIFDQRKVATAADNDEDSDAQPYRFAVVVPGLQPTSTYSCTARAVTAVGSSPPSEPVLIETSTMPPEICDLSMDSARHDCATISWRISEEGLPSADELEASLGVEAAAAVLAERQVRGYKVRIASLRGYAASRWNEVLGVRAKRGAALDHRTSIDLMGLEPGTTCFVQVAAVAVAEGVGNWCAATEVSTEALAPSLSRAPTLSSVSRRCATLQWVLPEDVPGTPVQAYVLYISKERDKGRRGAATQLELPLQGDSPVTTAELDVAEGQSFQAQDVCGEVYQEQGFVYAKIGLLEPGATYAVQVAAKTSRGTGASSAEIMVTTKPCAPRLRDGRPLCLEAYWNRLRIRCPMPEPDWNHGEEADVCQYWVRYYECGRLRNSPWTEVAIEDFQEAQGNTVEFWLPDLQQDKNYVIQCAAGTAAGRGAWSADSETLTTAAVAPILRQPVVLLATHSSMVVGWTTDEEGRQDSASHRHEEITDFALSLAPSSSGQRDVKTVPVTCRSAADVALRWSETAVAPNSDAATVDSEASGDIQPPTAAERSDASGSRRHPQYVAVVHDLSPNLLYTASVQAVTNAGEGRWSAKSFETSTLPVAPRVKGTQVDEVMHDQVVISWVHMAVESLLPAAACRQLGLVDSLEELEIRGYSVRWAAWTKWTRLGWKEPTYIEIEDLLGSREAGSSGEGRVQFTVTGLEAETEYVVEVRAHSSKGAGEWQRFNETQRVCTAIVAQPPPAPDLVYVMPHAVTFSFTGVDDARVVAYEVRRSESWAGGWCRPSKPLKFDAQSLAVRVTNEQRWVVNMDRLRSATTYVLQLRGITAAGGVTKWSARSAAMETLPDTGEEEEDKDAAFGVNEACATAEASPDFASRGSSSLTGATPSAQQDGGIESIEDVSKKLETILSFTMDKATAGVPLQGLQIPSVEEEAAELLQKYHGNKAQALAAAADFEDDASWRTKLTAFLIQQVPVLGCSTLLLRELWRTIRRVALIAHLNGHDLQSAETRALILTCLVPAGGGNAAAAQAQGCASSQSGAGLGEDLSNVINSRKVAFAVSRALAKETFVRMTGIKSAATAVDIMEAAGRTLATYSAADADKEKATKESSESGGGKTAPVDDAPRWFQRWRPSEAVPPAAGDGAANPEADTQPTPERLAMVVFKPQSVEERPATVLTFLVLWLMPIFVSVVRFVADRVVPFLAKRVQMELPVAFAGALFLFTFVAGILVSVWVQQNLDNFLSLPATLVFVVYNSIPGISIFMATRAIVRGATEAPFFAFLGVFNLSSGYLRWADDLSDDAALEKRPAPRIAGGRERVKSLRQLLWMALVLDFIMEEMLGRVFGLHSLRLLGPPLAKTDATLAEYRTVAFAMGLVAAWSQARLLTLLKKRTVLLRLLGARTTIYAGLSLIFMGAFAVVHQSQSLKFLRESSPSPWWCCAVLWIRQLGALAGFLGPVVFHVFASQGLLGAFPTDGCIALALLVGCVLGEIASRSFTQLWSEKKEHLESDYRVLHLFPHMSAQARSKASTAMRFAVKKGGQATRTLAAEWAAVSMTRSFFNIAVGKLTGASTPAAALP